MDAVFLSLEHLAAKLLVIEGGNTLGGKDALPLLPKLVDLFHKLSKTCEKAIDRIGEEFMDVT